MRNLPFAEIPLFAGVNTHFNPLTQAGRTLRVAKNVDTYSEFLSLGKVPGSSTVSNNAGSAIRSLHQFEFTDLDRIRKRHQLLLDDSGRLQRVEAGGGLTYLSAGIRLVGAPLVSVAAFDRIFFTSPEQTYLSTGGLKYDGSNVRRWGVLAPGQEEVVLQPITGPTGWTDSTDATLGSFGSGVYGGDALQVDKTGTASAVAYAEKSGLSYDFEVAGDGIFFVWLFIPASGLQLLAPSGKAVEVVIGDTGLTNADRHGFSVGELLPGWNQLSMSVLAPDSQDGAGATLTNIQQIRLQLNFVSTSTTATGFAWNKLFWGDDSAPQAAATEAGVVDTPVTYRVSYLSENGVESNGGAPSITVTPEEQKVELTGIPVSLDPQVIARRLYRDNNGDRIYRFVAQIDDNITTTFVDNVDDAALGGATMPIAGDDEIDSTPPPRFRSVAYAGNRIFGIDADNPIIIHVSDVNGPEQFRLIDQLAVDEELVSLEPHGIGITLFGRDRTYVLTGDGVSSPFRVDLVNTELGANSFRQTLMMRGLNITVREAEMFLVGDPRDQWLLNGPILDQFNALSASDRENGFVIHDRSRFRLVFFYGTKIFVYQYGTTGFQEITGDGAGTDPLDPRIGAWFTLELPATVEAKCAALVERAAETPELWIGASDGRVYHLNEDGQLNYATDYGSDPIAAEFESHPVPLGASRHPQSSRYTGQGMADAGRGEPRYLLLDAYSDGPATWTVTITVMSHADGVDLGSVTFDVTLPGGSASPIFDIPPIGVIGSWVRVKMVNARSGENGRFKQARIYYIPRTHFKGEQAA